MPTPVVMPQMGESIAEGTIVRWIKKVGDAVDRDEPLFEISTDKVDAEIPSPAAGVLTEIKVKEGETVAVNAVVATIGEASEAVTSKAPVQAPVQADGEGRTSEESAGDAKAQRPCRPLLLSAASPRPRAAIESSRTSVARSRRRSSAGSPRSTTSTSRRSTAPVSADA